MSPLVATRLRVQAVLELLSGGALALLACACVALTAWATLTTLVNEATRATFTPYSWLFGGLFAMLFGIPAIQLLSLARRNRDRVVALNGDATRLGESRLTLTSRNAPKVAASPFNLDVASGWLDQPIIAHCIAAYPVISVGMFGAALLRFFVTGDGGLLPQAMLAVFAALLVLLGPPWHTRTVYNVARTISADAQGLTWTTLLGGKHSVSWSEARLLEVARYRYRQNSIADNKRIVFTLYGAKTMLRWRDTLDWKAAHQTQWLLNLLASRVGLTPRTFDETLKPSRLDHLPQSIKVGRGVLSISSEPAGESTFAPSQGAYYVVWRQNSPRTRTSIHFIGAVLLLFDAVELARILGALDVAPFRPIASGGGSGDIAIGTLFLFALLFGPLLFVAAVLREKPGIVTATDTSLVVTRFRRTLEIPWSRLFELQRWTLPRDRGAFRAIDMLGRCEIAWPIHPRAWPGAVPPDAGTPVTSGQMAEIVAERIQASAQPAISDEHN